jgi:hypothetical protein
MKLKPLAVAVGVALPVSALASTISSTAETVSTEYLSVFGGIQAPAANLVLGAQYAAGDVITLTYSAAAKAGADANNATSTRAFTFPANLTIGTVATGSEVGSLAFFDSGDNFVKYRVVSAPAVSNAVVPSLPQPYFQTAGMAGADVTITPSSSTSQGLAFDTGVAKKIIDQTGSQFRFSVTGLSEVIDVESARQAFIIGTNAVSSAAFTITQVSTAAAGIGSSSAANVATAGTIAVVVNGDFSWLDSSTSSTGIQTDNITGTGVTVGAVTATQMALSIPAGGTTITFDNSLENTIPTQTLTVSLSGQFTGGGAGSTGAVTASASGAYSLNGSTVTVYAVPTSSAVNNFIWLTNSGSTSGDVQIIIYDNGTTYDLGVVGTSNAGEQLDITAAMNAAIASEGVTLSGGRVHLDIVTKVPASEVAVSAAYRVGDDRVNLLTSLETDND